METRGIKLFIFQYLILNVFKLYIFGGFQKPTNEQIKLFKYSTVSFIYSKSDGF